jgi:ribonuclease HI
MDFKSLIGLEVSKATKVLNDFGYNDIEEVKNSKENELCDSLVVCAVREKNKKITLVCGEFYLNVKEK